MSSTLLHLDSPWVIPPLLLVCYDILHACFQCMFDKQVSPVNSTLSVSLA